MINEKQKNPAKRKKQENPSTEPASADRQKRASPLSRRTLIVLVCVIAVVITLIATEHPSAQSAKRIANTIGLTDSERTVIGVTDIQSTDHSIGEDDVDVVLIEYSDFGCLLCAGIQDVYRRIVQDKKIRIISRHLYAGDSGPYFIRAVAAECVAKELDEDAYQQYASYLFENQREIDNEVDLLQEAIRLGVSADNFTQCLEQDTQVRKKILEQSEEGWSLGARGTPYVLVVYKDKPIGITYANNYQAFVERIELLIVQSTQR